MFLSKKITKALLAGLIICLSLSVRAQFNRQQVDHLNNKAEQWYYTPDSLLAFAKKAHQLAIESNYKNGEAIALKFLAIYEHTRGNFDVALGMYNEALIMLETVKNNFEIAKTTLSIASVYDAKNDHVNSLKYGLRSLRIFEELKDLKGQGKILNILGIVSAKQGDLKRAKTYFIQYNQISKKGTDTVSLAYSYNNLGGVNRDLRLIDSGLFYFKIAAKLFGKKRFLPGLALADKNIGAIYFDKKDFKNALHYAKKSLQNGSKSGDKKSIAVAYKEIGVCYRELKDTVSAYLNFNKALALAKTINDKEVLRDTYACLAELEDANKNYKSAYDNLQASRLAHDSLLNTEKTKVIQDLTTKYETAKKEKEIKSLNQEALIHKLKLKQRNILLIVAICLLALGIIFSYLFYNRRKLKEQTRLQSELNKQQEQATKAVLSAEENERIRIATDLHDGVGQLLSTALMNLNGLVNSYRYNDENEREKTQNVLSLINESYDEMRSISHQMMPNALIKAGLTAAVKDFLHKIDKDKLKISLEIIGLNTRLDHQVETVLYRVIQETVNNVIKHAKATKLNIQFLKDDDGVSITIEDNGKGFDLTLLQKSTGIGLKNIISRINFLKGTIDFDTAPGKGTLVAIHIPE
jgi:signal transduction histidine kinase